MNQRLLLARAQRERLLEVADVRIDLARRHALGQHDLADHGREAFDDGVAVHRERPDPAFAMAARAVVGKDRRDVLRISDRRFAMVAIGRCDVLDGSAARPRLRLLDLTAGKHVVDCAHQVLVGRTAIEHLSRAGLNQEHFADLADAEAFGDQLRLVHQHRDVEAMLVQFLLHRLARFIRDRVEHEELDPAFVLRARFLERGEILVAHRAGAALNQQRNRLVIVVIAHLVEVALLVQQGEISDPFRIGSRNRGSAGAEQRQRKNRSLHKGVPQLHSAER
jgi:hypothetical protein